jgi:hypothetical protein
MKTTCLLTFTTFHHAGLSLLVFSHKIQSYNDIRELNVPRAVLNGMVFSPSSPTLSDEALM